MTKQNSNEYNSSELTISANHPAGTFPGLELARHQILIHVGRAHTSRGTREHVTWYSRSAHVTYTWLTRGCTLRPRREYSTSFELGYIYYMYTLCVCQTEWTFPVRIREGAGWTPVFLQCWVYPASPNLSRWSREVHLKAGIAQQEQHPTSLSKKIYMNSYLISSRYRHNAYAGSNQTSHPTLIHSFAQWPMDCIEKGRVD